MNNFINVLTGFEGTFGHYDKITEYAFKGL